jgi:hypothetical protein
VQAAKQSKAKIFLKAFDLVANGAMRDAEFLCGTAETGVPGRGLEGP